MIKNVKTAFLVLVRPKATFENLGENHIALWAAAMVLLSVTMLAKPVLTAPVMKARSRQTAKALLARMERDEAKGKGQPMPPAIKAQMRKSAEEGTPVVFLIVGGVTEAIALWAAAALSALLIMGLVKLLKGTIAYKSALAVIGLAFMPFLIGEALKIAVAAATGSLAMSGGMSSLIMSSPAEAMAGDSAMSGPGFALALTALQRIDIFVIWSLALLAVGVVRVGGLGKIKGMVLSALYWLITWTAVAIPAVIGSLVASKF